MSTVQRPATTPEACTTSCRRSVISWRPRPWLTISMVWIKVDAPSDARNGGGRAPGSGVARGLGRRLQPGVELRRPLLAEGGDALARVGVMIADRGLGGDLVERLGPGHLG